MTRGAQIGIGVLAVAAGVGVGLYASSGDSPELDSSTLETLGKATAAEVRSGQFERRVSIPDLSVSKAAPAPATPDASDVPDSVATPSTSASPSTTSTPPPPTTTQPPTTTTQD